MERFLVFTDINKRTEDNMRAIWERIALHESALQMELEEKRRRDEERIKKIQKEQEEQLLRIKEEEEKKKQIIEKQRQIEKNKLDLLNEAKQIMYE